MFCLLREHLKTQVLIFHWSSSQCRSPRWFFLYFFLLLFPLFSFLNKSVQCRYLDKVAIHSVEGMGTQDGVIKLKLDEECAWVGGWCGVDVRAAAEWEGHRTEDDAVVAWKGASEPARVRGQDEGWCLWAASSCLGEVSEPQRHQEGTVWVLGGQGKKKLVNKYIYWWEVSYCQMLTNMGQEKTRMNPTVSDCHWRLSWFSR